MKAVIVNKDGFMKYITVDKKEPYFRRMASFAVNIYPLSDKRSAEPVPIIEYELERDYTNEFGETILIYKEY